MNREQTSERTNERMHEKANEMLIASGSSAHLFWGSLRPL